MSDAARIVAAAAGGPEAVDAALHAATGGRHDPELAAVAAAARALAAELADARRDPLTGLPHRGALATAPAGAAVLAIDVDALKATNDAHGHDAGDALLAAVAAALRAALRRGDTLFRTGGDEFVAHLHDADGAAARAAAERLCAAVRRATDGTVSIGVAIPAPGEPPAATRARADRAAYAAKAAGRDGVALAEPA